MSVTREGCIWLHCNSCLGVRLHTPLYSTKREYIDDRDEENPYHEISEYTVAECNGCEAVTMQTSWRNSGNESISEQWPPKVSRRQPKWMFELPGNITNSFKHEFIREIYSSLKTGNFRLTVLGVRALLEQVMLEHIEDKGSFRQNLEQFETCGFISRIQREAIGPVIEAGHASMHRGFKATEHQVEAMLDVTENIIESIYITKTRSTGLNVPARNTTK